MISKEYKTLLTKLNFTSDEISFINNLEFELKLISNP